MPYYCGENITVFVELIKKSEKAERNTFIIILVEALLVGINQYIFVNEMHSYLVIHLFISLCLVKSRFYKNALETMSKCLINECTHLSL